MLVSTRTGASSFFDRARDCSLYWGLSLGFLTLVGLYTSYRKFSCWS